MKNCKIDSKNGFKNSFENSNDIHLMQEFDNGAKMYMRDLGGGDHVVWVEPPLSYYYEENVRQFEPTFQKRYNCAKKVKGYVSVKK